MDAIELPVEWTDAGDGARSVDLDGQHIVVIDRPDGLHYRRDSVRGAVKRRLAGATGVAFRIGACPETAIAQLDAPLALEADEKREVWVEWPLEVRAVPQGGAGSIDVFRPGLRRSLFGSVTGGRVLPGARTRLVPELDPAPVAHRPAALLRVQVSNRSGAAALLPRFPVEGSRLRLFTRDGAIAGGDVRVVIDRDGDTEAETAPGAAPPGWVEVAGPASDGNTTGLARIRWKLFTTILSSEAPD